MSEIKPRQVRDKWRCSRDDCPSWKPRYLKSGKELANGICSQDPNDNIVVENETICLAREIAAIRTENEQLRAEIAAVLKENAEKTARLVRIASAEPTSEREFQPLPGAGSRPAERPQAAPEPPEGASLAAGGGALLAIDEAEGRGKQEIARGLELKKKVSPER